jgi:flagellar biosynthetic protein FliQ
VNLDQVTDWTREALRMTLLLGGPLLVSALLVGLIVNILQTLTQLNEPVVGLVPRVATVIVVALLLIPWLLGRWISFTVDLIASIPNML